MSGTAPIAHDGSAAFPGDVYRQTKLCLDPDTSDARGHHQLAGRRATFAQIVRFIDPAWLVETEADCYIGST